jgi:hypothetical protein
MKGEKSMKKILALLLVFTFIFAFSACTGNNKETTTAAATTIAEVTTLPGDTTAAVTTLSGETTTAATTLPGQTTTAPAVTTTKPAAVTIKAPVGGTISQIVAFYNQYANATKAYTGTVKVQKTSGTTSVINYVAYAWAVKSIALDKLPHDYARRADETFKNGKQVGGTDTLVKHLPRDSDAKMSVLDPAGVLSATCVKSGSGWKVLITLKSETVNSLSAVPKYHSQCMDTLSIKDSDLNPFTLQKASVNYTDATTITAVVNAKGLLDSVNIFEPARITGDLTYPPLGFQLKNTDVTGTYKDEYVFIY